MAEIHIQEETKSFIQKRRAIALRPFFHEERFCKNRLFGFLKIRCADKFAMIFTPGNVEFIPHEILSEFFRITPEKKEKKIVRKFFHCFLRFLDNTRCPEECWLKNKIKSCHV